jgi:hypothetical protein
LIQLVLKDQSISYVAVAFKGFAEKDFLAFGILYFDAINFEYLLEYFDVLCILDEESLVLYKEGLFPELFVFLHLHAVSFG